MKKSAFFLDRDGVVIRQVSYLHTPEQVELETGIPEALRRIHDSGALAVVVTNQSGVARGMFTREDVEKVHARIQELLAPFGERIDGFFTCFHHPDFTGPCACRKPAPGLFLEAAERLGRPEKTVIAGNPIRDGFDSADRDAAFTGIGLLF